MTNKTTNVLLMLPIKTKLFSFDIIRADSNFASLYKILIQKIAQPKQLIQFGTKHFRFSSFHFERRYI